MKKEFKIILRVMPVHNSERGCKRKVRYGHQHTAGKAAAAMAEKHARPFDVYECPTCSGWHITKALSGI